MTNLETYQKRTDALLAQYQHAAQSVQEERQTLRDAKQHIAHIAEAQTIAQEVAAAVQESVHRQISAVVSVCLQTIFEEESYSFKIDFAQKRGKTEAVLSFVKGDYELDPMTAAGGGGKDIAAFALRLASIVLSEPRRRDVGIFDEPFANLKPPEKFGPRVVALIEKLSDDMGIQFIMVNNIPEYQCG